MKSNSGFPNVQGTIIRRFYEVVAKLPSRLPRRCVATTPDLGEEAIAKRREGGWDESLAIAYLSADGWISISWKFSGSRFTFIVHSFMGRAIPLRALFAVAKPVFFKRRVVSLDLLE